MPEPRAEAQGSGKQRKDEPQDAEQRDDSA